MKGSVRMCRYVIYSMLKNLRVGVIINISLTSAISGYTECSVYTIAKAGIIAMTKHIALEYDGNMLRAYTLNLGNNEIEATYNPKPEKNRLKATQVFSMKRWGKPKELAKAVPCIASENILFGTGNTIVTESDTVLLYYGDYYSL